MGYDEKEKQLKKYLDRNYIIKEKKFFTVSEDVHEWGSSIVGSLSTIFSFEYEFCENIFRHWAYARKMSKKTFEVAWNTNVLKTIEVACGTNVLKASWTVEMAEDLRAFHSIDVEAELTALLTRVINSQIISELIRNE